jgi:hypothetical protein
MDEVQAENLGEFYIWTRGIVNPVIRTDSTRWIQYGAVEFFYPPLGDQARTTFICDGTFPTSGGLPTVTVEFGDLTPAS